MSILPIIVILLCLAGLWDASYFTLAYYGRVKKASWVPEILCAREGSNCVTVVQTPYARVFIVPNSLLGVLFYLAVIFWVVLALALDPRAYPAGHRMMVTIGGLLVVAAGFAVVLGLYLIYSLVSVLRTHCPLCYAAHAINAVLLVLIAILDSRLAGSHFG